MDYFETTIDGTRWRYTDDGANKRALLCLPGAMGAIDSGRAALEPLRAYRRIVQVAYPDVPTFAQFSHGVFALLNQRGVVGVDILGSSLGGYLAQCLARDQPRRVGALVLVHTYVMDEKGGRKLAMANRGADMIPRGLFERLAWLKLRAVLRPVRALSPSTYAATLSQVRDNVRTTLNVARIKRNNDWMIQTAGGAAVGTGRRVLIIESDNDRAIRASARAALRAAYPDASVVTFAGTGHVTMLVAPQEFAAAVGEFLLVLA